MLERRFVLVREFDIENEKGQRFSLMNIENGCFLNSPRRTRLFL
nr:MAG TPA: Baseplate protein [Caudoviricetes sp.]